MTRPGVLVFLAALVGASFLEIAAQHRLFLRIIAVADAEKAVEVVVLLESGQSFASLARRFSNHPTAARGGYLGETYLDRLSRQFRLTAVALEPGTYSAPFEAEGSHIILYREKKDFREIAYGLQREGERLAEEGKLDDALGKYEDALRVFPDFIHAHFLMGVTYSQKGLIDREIASYQEALEIEPRYHQALYNLGLAQIKIQRLGEAVGALERAVAIKPDYTDCWVSLSAAYLSLGQVGKAIEAARRAVDMNPLRPEGYYNLGAALVRRNPQAGLQQFRIASTLNPARADLKMAVVVTLGQLGQQEQAIELLQKLVREHPEFQPARKLLSQLGLGSPQ